MTDEATMSPTVAAVERVICEIEDELNLTISEDPDWADASRSYLQGMASAFKQIRERIRTADQAPPQTRVFEWDGTAPRYSDPAAQWYTGCRCEACKPAAPATPAEQTFVLRADGLMSKYGFDDGDVFRDLIETEAVKHEWPTTIDDGNDLVSLPHQVLIVAVDAYLMPVIKEAGIDVAVYAVPTHHNPVRARRVGIIERHQLDRELSSIEAVVTASQAIEIAEMLVKQNHDER